ncbi:Phosphoserine phosphatase 1 [compost metagenome]
MKIFLIRHGQSIMNTSENFDEIPDHAVHLTQKGKKQASKAGEFMKRYIEENNIDITKARLWISPYKRTRETAELFNEHVNVLDIQEDFRIVEQQYGLFDGMSDEEIAREFPRELKVFERNLEHKGKFYARYPDGESAFDVAIRVKSFIGSIIRDYEKKGTDTLFIVSHGLTTRIILQTWLKHSPEWLSDERNPSNCSIRLIDGREDKGYIFIPQIED